VLCLPTGASASDPVDFAASLIGSPYVWGAEGPDSFDCSGLTQYVFQEFGIELPRRAISQSKVGDRTTRLKRGDLLFFANDARRSVVTHVGIYEAGGIMINASKRGGRVRRDDLDDGFWSDRFMFARRIALGARSEPDQRATRLPEPRSAGRRAALRVLEHAVDLLIRRPRR
jgi:cell wall-associated NlpC family hydrolase